MLNLLQHSHHSKPLYSFFNVMISKLWHSSSLNVGHCLNTHSVNLPNKLSATFSCGVKPIKYMFLVRCTHINKFSPTYYYILSSVVNFFIHYLKYYLADINEQNLAIILKYKSFSPILDFVCILLKHAEF